MSERLKPGEGALDFTAGVRRPWETGNTSWFARSELHLGLFDGPLSGSLFAYGEANQLALEAGAGLRFKF